MPFRFKEHNTLVFFWCHSKSWSHLSYFRSFPCCCRICSCIRIALYGGFVLNPGSFYTLIMSLLLYPENCMQWMKYHACLSNSIGSHMRDTFLITLPKLTISILPAIAVLVNKVLRGHRFGIMGVKGLDLNPLSF